MKSEDLSPKIRERIAKMSKQHPEQASLMCAMFYNADGVLDGHRFEALGAKAGRALKIYRRMFGVKFSTGQIGDDPVGLEKYTLLPPPKSHRKLTIREKPEPARDDSADWWKQS